MSEQFWLTRDATGSFVNEIHQFDRPQVPSNGSDGFAKGYFTACQEKGWVNLLQDKIDFPVPPGTCVGPCVYKDGKIVLVEQEQPKRFWVTLDTQGSFGVADMWHGEPVADEDGEYWSPEGKSLMIPNGLQVAKVSQRLGRPMTPGECLGPFPYTGDGPTIEDIVPEVHPVTPEPKPSSRVTMVCITLTDTQGNDLEVTRLSDTISISTGENAYFLDTPKAVDSLCVSLKNLLAFDAGVLCK